MSEWKQTTLGQFVSLQRGHDLPETVRQSGQVPVMGSFGITGWHNVARASGPGVTVGRSGASIGVVSRVQDDYWPLNTCLFVTDFHGNNPHFVYYLLKTTDLAGMNSGSAQPSLNRNYVYPLPISIPERLEQDRIADLLNNLDEKIDLNRRMNETLEQTARALFKDWFVDFGPTKAKMVGQAAYLEGDLWDLFPERLDEAGVPEGWAMRNIYEFARVIYGAPFASKRFNTEGKGLPLIRIRDLATHEPSIFTDEVHPKGHLINSGDIVVGMDGEFRMHVWKGEQAWLNQRVCHFKPLDDIPVVFIAEAIIEPLSYFERGKVGTTVIHLGKSDIDTFKIISPEKSVIATFGKLVDPLLERIVSNAFESRTLAQTRDLLLPKLMSGELRIRDAEALVAEQV